MKTEFPIYWVDDEPDVVESKKIAIEEYLGELGFKSKIEIRKKLSDGWTDEVRDINPYFVVMDFNLPESGGHGEDGNGGGEKFIKELREKGCLHDIIFYTSGGFPHQKIGDLFKNGGLEIGVSFIDKEKADGHFKRLIDQRISEFSDLSTQRGWVVADSIAMETKLGNLILELSGAFPAPFRKSMKRIVEDSIRADFGCRRVLAAGLIKDIVSFMIEEKADEKLLTQLKKCKTVFGTFSEEVVELRNTIAHQEEAGEDGEFYLKPRQRGVSPYEEKDSKNGRKIIYNDAFLQKVRRNFTRQSTNLDELLELSKNIHTFLNSSS